MCNIFLLLLQTTVYIILEGEVEVTGAGDMGGDGDFADRPSKGVDSRDSTRIFERGQVRAAAATPQAVRKYWLPRASVVVPLGNG